MAGKYTEQERQQARDAALNFIKLFSGPSTPEEFWVFAEATLAPHVVEHLKTLPYEMVTEDYAPLYDEWYVDNIITEMFDK